jgi:hypothetical protein
MVQLGTAAPFVSLPRAVFGPHRLSNPRSLLNISMMDLAFGLHTH